MQQYLASAGLFFWSFWFYPTVIFWVLSNEMSFTCPLSSCRGTWSYLELKTDHLYFFTETAWKPPFALLKLIQKVYPSLSFYFSAEGDDWDAYLTNDAEGKYFSSRYIVDCEPDIEYFDTIEEACDHLSAYIGKPVAASWKALNEAADEWNDENPDSDWPINVKRFEIIGNEELGD